MCIKNKLLAVISFLMTSTFSMAGGFIGGEPFAMDALMDAFVLERIHFDNQPVYVEEHFEDEAFLLVDSIPEDAFVEVLNIVKNTKKPLSVTQMMKLLEQIRLKEFAQELLFHCKSRLENPDVLNADLKAQLEILISYIQAIHGEITQFIVEEGEGSNSNNHNDGWFQYASGIATEWLNWG